jgi:hypothetical protein
VCVVTMWLEKTHKLNGYVNTTANSSQTAQMDVFSARHGGEGISSPDFVGQCSRKYLDLTRIKSAANYEAPYGSPRIVRI